MARQRIPTSVQHIKQNIKQMNVTTHLPLWRTELWYCSVHLLCIVFAFRDFSWWASLYRLTVNEQVDTQHLFQGHTSERWWTPAACFRKSNQDLWVGPINPWSSLLNHIAVFNTRSRHWYFPMYSNNYIFKNCLQFLWNLRKLQQTSNVSSWKTGQYHPHYLDDSYKTHSQFKHVPYILYLWEVYNSLPWSNVISLHCWKNRKQPPCQLQCVILICRL